LFTLKHLGYFVAAADAGGITGAARSLHVSQPSISAALFSIGLLAALSRRHAIFILIGIELMLAAANLNFIAFWRFGPETQNPTGVMVAIFSIAIAAAEAAVGLALIIAVYRHYRTTNVRRFDQLKG